MPERGRFLSKPYEPSELVHVVRSARRIGHQDGGQIHFVAPGFAGIYREFFFPLCLWVASRLRNTTGGGQMRKITVAVLTLCVAGCATAAEQEVDRMKTSAARDAAARSCDTQVEPMPEYQSIKAYMPTDDGPSLATQTNSSKATPEEIRSIFAVHAAMAPCRKIRVEAADDESTSSAPAGRKICSE